MVKVMISRMTSVSVSVDELGITIPGTHRFGHIMQDIYGDTSQGLICCGRDSVGAGHGVGGGIYGFYYMLTLECPSGVTHCRQTC